MFDSWWHHYRFGNKKSLELLKFKGFLFYQTFSCLYFGSSGNLFLFQSYINSIHSLQTTF